MPQTYPLLARWTARAAPAANAAVTTLGGGTLDAALGRLLGSDVMDPKPQVVAQRTVECRVLTPAGWVLGRLRSPLNTPLLDYLNQREPFLRLTDVSIPPRHDRHDFFAVGLESAVAWIPQETQAVEEMTAGLGTVAHATSWLLPGGVVLDGHLDLDPGERVSDHLLHRKGFVVIKDVTLILPHGGAFLPGEFTYEVLALQSARAVGVTELPTQP